MSEDACTQLALGANRPNWSMIASAPVTSQAIGVLAALVFGGILLLLESPRQPNGLQGRYSAWALSSLMYIFFALVVSSFFFAIISGELICTRAFIEGAFASALFAVAAMATFLSICWLAAAHGVEKALLSLMKMIILTVILTGYTFTTLAILDAVLVTQDKPDTEILLWGVIPLVLPTFVGIVAWLPSVYRWFKERAAALFALTLAASLGTSVLAIAGFSWISAIHPDPKTFPLILRIAVTCSVTVLMALYLANLIIIQPAGLTAPHSSMEPDRQSPSPDLNMTTRRYQKSLFRITIELRRR